VEYRGQIGVMLDVSPSLRPTIAEDLAECYADAHEVASGETGLPLDVFPLACPWTAAQVVRAALWPVGAHACDTTPRGVDDDETATD
jgi:hypothetical protein